MAIERSGGTCRRFWRFVGCRDDHGGERRRQAAALASRVVPAGADDRGAERSATKPARYHVVGIGNALVDVIAHHDDEFIDDYALVKGSMTLIEAERALSLHAAMVAPIEMSGGSRPTRCAVASFGGRAALHRQVAPDGLGEAFRHDLHAEGVAFPNPRRERCRPASA